MRLDKQINETGCNQIHVNKMVVLSVYSIESINYN